MRGNFASDAFAQAGGPIIMSDEFEYHSRRSLEELRIGLSAPCPAAAQAHLALSSLHLRRARLLEGLGIAASELLRGDR